MRAVEMERCNGSRAVENGCVIAFRIDPFDVFLFEEPIEAAPARIGAFLQHVARDFLGLARDAHGSVPDQRYVHVEQ